MDMFKSLSTTAKAVLGVLFLGFVGANMVAFIFYNGPIQLTTIQPEQPIPFSHKLHAGDNQIPCQYCHSDARRSEAAGVPPTRKCMNCHVVVKTESPEIAKVTEYDDNNKPIEWVRVFDLPDHVWFNHKRHIKKDIACQKCHGKVEEMEVLAKTVEHKMGFCLNCHQENGAPTDCWTCHT